MSFVNLDGRVFNTRSIRIATYDRDEGNTIVQLEGEDTPIRVFGDYREEIARASATIIPAHPGWSLLHYDAPRDDLPEWVLAEPIIAWRVVEVSDNLAPMTADWNDNDVQDRHYIRRPDGSVMKPGDRSWLTMEEWLSYMREAAKKKEPAS